MRGRTLVATRPGAAAVRRARLAAAVRLRVAMGKAASGFLPRGAPGASTGTFTTSLGAPGKVSFHLLPGGWARPVRGEQFRRAVRGMCFQGLPRPGALR